MDPGWTNYRKTCLYNSYDVTTMVEPGQNVVAVMLGNGMYNVPGGLYTKFKGTFGPPKLICQTHVTFTDGSIRVISSDKTWKWAPGPILFTCIFGGEDYDARRAARGPICPADRGGRLSCGRGNPAPRTRSVRDGLWNRIESPWWTENAHFYWHITVPANTSAEVHVPAGDVETVAESGRPAALASGLTFLRTEPGGRIREAIGRAVFEVGSGEYEFHSALQQSASEKGL